jgi:hypothetical protein
MATLATIPDNADIIKPYPALWPAQVAFMKAHPTAEVDICCYQGGYGSGKTFAGSLLGLMLAIKYPGSVGLVVAKTWPMLQQTTLQSYFEHMAAFGMEAGTHYTWHATDHRLELYNGSKILFRHIQQPDTVKSLNCGWIEVEEMGMLSEDDFLMLLSRLRQPGLGRYRLFGHTNPQPFRGWLYRYFVERQSRQSGVVYRRVIASTLDNRALPASYYHHMQDQFDAEYYRMNVLGEDADPTGNGGRVCHNWGPANVVPTTYKPDLRLYISCDFNIDPMCWVIAHRYNGEYHFIDELCLENCSTQQAADAFFDRYHAHLTGVIITGDASGQNRGSKAKNALETDYTILRNRLTQLGMPNVILDVRAGNPPVSSRVQAWNAQVCDSKEVRRVRVDPRCRYLIENCENLSYQPGTSHIKEPNPRQIELQPKLKFTKHVFDAASYLVERYDPIRLDVPPHRRPSLVFRQFRPNRGG